jgi:predicted  nucleic acid-binding Zn-ribbon protein
MLVETDLEAPVKTNDLVAMLDGYRSRTRDLPTYEELQIVAAELESLKKQVEETLNKGAEYYGQLLEAKRELRELHSSRRDDIREALRIARDIGSTAFMTLDEIFAATVAQMEKNK